MSNKACNLTEFDKQRVVNCIFEAFGDDTKACMRRERINERKSVSKKFLKWDLVNRNFLDNFKEGNLTAEYAKRGGWYFVPLYDRENGTLITVMREDRFAEIQKKRPERKTAHYIDALVTAFNFDLTENQQYTLFDTPSFEEEKVKNIVENILKEFKIGVQQVKRYATVLFEEYGGEVTSVRCCTLNGSLLIIDEEDWNCYLRNNESVVVETVNNEDLELPEIGLKEKAKKKIDQKELVALKNNTVNYRRQIK